MKKVLITLVGIILFFSLTGCGGNDKSSDTDTSSKSEYTVENGKLLETHKNGKSLVVKVKIESNLSNKLTIDQKSYI